ncbi:Adaptor protein complex 4 (AP-4); epsilon subunit; B [Paratrimastix pyriformis]|uniref:Adaptor protein complex 4 (AP-4) n=1 Tax=Paratrimastix pyriformis TaxID=342808 RepID=A0ABQ8UIN5_9EUKA|nr:Adaptor protein complex 4 (AP-4); epsilon subunit; B [Paratrimastix pyriformis]
MARGYDVGQVDLNLTFLNPFIERCLQEGARPYVPAPQRTADTMAMASPVPGLPPDAEGPEVADAAAFATGIVGDLTAPAAPESGLKFEAYDAPPEATAVSQSTVPTAIANPDQMSAQAPLKTVTTAVSSETLTAQPRKREEQQQGLAREEIIEGVAVPKAAPRQLSEKEKMASMLFGGAATAGPVTPTAGAGRGSIAARRAAKAAASRAPGTPLPSGSPLLPGLAAAAPATPPTAPAAPAGNPMDLLMMMSSAGAAPAPAPEAATEDLFGGMAIVDSPAPSTPPRPAAPPPRRRPPRCPGTRPAPAAAAAEFLALFGAPTAAPKAPAAAPAAGGLLDFAFGGPSAAGSAGSMSFGGSSRTALVATFTNQNATFPRSHPEPDRILSSAPNQPLAVHYLAIWKPTELVLGLFISNEGGAPLDRPSIKACPAPGAMVQVTQIALEGGPVGAGGVVALGESLRPGETVAVTVTLLPAATFGPNAASLLALPCVLSYETPAPRSQPLNVPTGVKDLLRPLSLTTAQFGQNWGQHSVERVVRLERSGIASCAAFMERAKLINFHAVDIRGTECIIAGKLARSEHTVLVHCKIIGGPSGPLDFKVRSKQPALSDAVLALCKTAFM